MHITTTLTPGVQTWRTTADFKNGLGPKIDNKLQQIIEFQHVKPGKGARFLGLKDVVSGRNIDKTFNAAVKVETATVDRRDMTYLYNDGENFVVMDGQGLRAVREPRQLRDAGQFLLENMRVA